MPQKARARRSKTPSARAPRPSARERLAANLAEAGCAIVHIEEKHGAAFYVVHNLDELALVALAILHQRYHAGWYPEPDGPPEPPTCQASEIAVMRPGPVREAAERELASYGRRQRDYEVERLNYADIERALRSRDGYLAHDLLRGRTNYEYERYELVWPSTPDLPDGDLLATPG